MLDKKQSQSRIEKLKKEIEYHRHLYHVLDKQEISESALDSLKHELFLLEQEYPDLITPDSPTQRVGGRPLDKFVKVKHSKPVLSLEDVFNSEEILKWEDKNKKVADGDYNYYCELKLDGLTVVLTYEDGKFVRGATRGDGLVGEDVTQNLKTIQSIPLSLNKEAWNKLKNRPKIFEVRGETVMTKKVFEAINRQQAELGLPLFANPRNVAAGSIRQLDSQVTSDRKLDCFTFEIISDVGQTTHEEVHQILKSLGFKVNPHNEYCKTLKDVNNYLQKWDKERKKLAYQTDGVVIVVNDLTLEKRLGFVGKADRWMAAFKFPAEQATTKVLDIVLQVGRVGTITPVAELNPVLLAGSTVARATLHNIDEINRLDVRVGDTVIVQKAGDIIPDIVKVLPNLRTGKEKKFTMPKNCPVCSGELTRPDGEVNYYCFNNGCAGRHLEELVHFVSKKAMNIAGLGPRILEQLLEKKLIKTPADLFLLKPDDFLKMEGFADLSAEKMFNAIQKAKNPTLKSFIYSLGIRHAGEETAHALATHFGSLENIIKADQDELQRINDIGVVVAESVSQYFKQSANLKLLQAFKEAGVVPQKMVAPKDGGKLAGKTLVLTGALTSFSRDEAEDKIRSLGGHPSSAVSAKTDYLVAGEKTGSKYTTAQKLGVKILTEQEFLEMMK